MKTVSCTTWTELHNEIKNTDSAADSLGEMIWYRGTRNANYPLLPSLMRETEGTSLEDHDQYEADSFFEFQALGAELRNRNLTEWETLFFARHYGLPTRVLDWTDTFAIA